MRRAPPRLPLWREAALASVSHSSGAVGHVLPHGAYPRSPSPVFRLPPSTPWWGGCTGIRENRADLTRRGGPPDPPFWAGQNPSTVVGWGYPPFFGIFAIFTPKNTKNHVFSSKNDVFLRFFTFFHVFSQKTGVFGPPQKTPKNVKKRGQKWPKMAKNGGLPPPP